MKVTIENYTEHCLKTWGGENQKERAKLGIIGELGEVAEVLKKYLRGDFDEVERDKRLLKELGDSTYYIAIDIQLEGHYDFIEEVKYANKESSRKNFSDLSNIELLKLTQSRFCAEYDPHFYISTLIEFMERYVFTIEQVMQANIEKLTKRAKNGLIQGDGDNRGE